MIVLQIKARTIVKVTVVVVLTYSTMQAVAKLLIPPTEKLLKKVEEAGDKIQTSYVS